MILCLLLSYIFLLQYCAASNSLNSGEQEKYKKIAVIKLGENLKYYFNESRTYILICKENKPSVKAPTVELRFIIYDLKNDSLLFEDTIGAGTAKWKNNTQIDVNIIPGNVSIEFPDRQYGYIYDVNLKKKLNKLSGEISNN